MAIVTLAATVLVCLTHVGSTVTASDAAAQKDAKNADPPAAVVDRSQALAILRAKIAEQYVIPVNDNEILEGMMPNDLSQSSPEGFLINPPDLRSNTQRIFVPRGALDSLTVLVVIGATRRRRRGLPIDTRQVQLFGESS